MDVRVVQRQQEVVTSGGNNRTTRVALCGRGHKVSRHYKRGGQTCPALKRAEEDRYSPDMLVYLLRYGARWMRCWAVGGCSVTLVDVNCKLGVGWVLKDRCCWYHSHGSLNWSAA